MSTFTSARSVGARAGFTFLLLAGLAGVMAAGAASAAGAGSDASSVTVKYSQQSLATNDGVSILYRRIRFAATRVCPDATIGDLEGQYRVSQCREQAVAVAIRQIGNPQLAALHAKQSKNG
jgi:UrcA family protein